MNRIILFCLFIILIASCKKEKKNVDYDSLIKYQLLSSKTFPHTNCNCDTGYVDWAFYVPNAFTPNGDGQNETWEPKWCGLDSSVYHVSIFDKTGKIIFEVHSPAKFDGRGKDGMIMLMQSLGYYIEAKDKNGEHYTFQGKFMLFK